MNMYLKLLKLIFNNVTKEKKKARQREPAGAEEPVHQKVVEGDLRMILKANGKNKTTLLLLSTPRWIGIAIKSSLQIFYKDKGDQV